MTEITLSDISKYLSSDVLEKAFKQRTKSDDEIESVEITRAAPSGEGLIGAVYRIHVTGKQHRASFVAKGLANDLLLRKSLQCTRYFLREVLFFTKILPQLVEFQQKYGTEDFNSIVPKYYSSHQDGVNDYILMEDLSELGYKSISQNPTEVETDLTLKVLAHLHAVSMALRVLEPEKFVKIADTTPEIYYTEDNYEWYKPYLQNAVDIDKKVIIENEDENSIYYKKFNELVNSDLYRELINITSKRGSNAVLCHGDAWCPNFLCTKDAAATIDFQLLRIASPVTDLTVFIFLCGNLCRSKQTFLNAVDIYYKYLEHYLKDLGLKVEDVFTRQDLDKEMKKYGKFGLIASLTSIPLLASERCDVLGSFESKFSGWDMIPLEMLWPLSPIVTMKHKMSLVNIIRIAVDVGLI